MSPSSSPRSGLPPHHCPGLLLNSLLALSVIGSGCRREPPPAPPPPVKTAPGEGAPATTPTPKPPAGSSTGTRSKPAGTEGDKEGTGQPGEAGGSPEPTTGSPSAAGGTGSSGGGNGAPSTPGAGSGSGATGGQAVQNFDGTSLPDSAADAARTAEAELDASRAAEQKGSLRSAYQRAARALQAAGTFPQDTTCAALADSARGRLKTLEGRLAAAAGNLSRGGSLRDKKLIETP